VLEGVFFQRHRFLRSIVARPRLLICTAVGFAMLIMLPGEWRLSTRALMAWNAGILVYLATAVEMMIHSSAHTIRRRAALVDESRFVVLILACVAAATSIVAIVAQLAAVKEMHGLLKDLHVGLAAVTIVSAWTFIHVVFAQHYAHEYFVERRAERTLPEDQRGGLRFAGAGQPDYLDFLYLSFVIGVAAQTADVEICSKTMRRVALAHCVLSFFFNTTVLALTINIAAGLI
jgi:uncharacterized membrane protein